MMHICPGCGKRRRVKRGTPIVCECYVPGTKEGRRGEVEGRAVHVNQPEANPVKMGKCSIAVSVEFWSGALKLLTRIHGNRQAGPLIEDIRTALAEAEMFYKALPIIDATKRHK